MRQFIALTAAAGCVAAILAGCSSGGGGGGANVGGGAGAGGGGNQPGFGAGPGIGGMPATGGSAGAAGMASGGASGGGGSPPVPGAIGAPCTSNDQCGTGLCIKDSEGWPNGYCTVIDCKAGTCPAGSDCFETTSGNTYCLKTCAGSNDCAPDYACHKVGACVPACKSNTDCDTGKVCDTATGLCGNAPCTPTSCAAGMKCDSVSGECIPDVGNGPPPGPGPDCTGKLPQRDCTGTLAYCGELLPFEPDLGPGYWDYPLNGETQTNQYRSYLRRDAQMLVKYAAAWVDCKAQGWNTGIGGALGLGDMSEGNGAIPGTSIGQPGHPAGTHLNGLDIDIAYFQVGQPDNKLRPVCPHTTAGKDAYHCTAAPDILDLWRTTLYLGALMTSEIVRVIGVDGQVGPLVEKAAPALCSQGYLPAISCSKMGAKLAYETTNQGYGWYLFHHHHFHLSTTGKLPTNPNAIAPDLGLDTALVANQTSNLDSLMTFANVAGHGHVHEAMPVRLQQELPGLGARAK